MAEELGGLVVTVSADIAKFTEGMNKAQHQAAQFASNFKRAASAIAGLAGGFFSTEKILEFGKAVLEATEKYEQSSLRLGAVLNATGYAAGVTRKELDDMAEAMAASTQFDDLGIRNAAAELLKFRSIQGETFREALKLSADVAAFFGEDIPAAAAKLGKSLVEPETGFGLLKRAGIALTDSQKDMIRSMDLAGDKAGAQKVILDEVRRSMGGTAETMNSGINKSTSDLVKNWDDLLIAIGRTPGVTEKAQNGLNAMARVMKFVSDGLNDRNKYAETFETKYGLKQRPAIPLTPEQGGRVPGNDMLAGFTMENIEEKFKAADGARAQKEKDRAEAATRVAKLTQGINSDMRKATLENEAAITDDERIKANLRFEAAKEEMNKKLQELEKSGVSRKAVETEYTNWLESEEAKRRFNSRSAVEQLADQWKNTTKLMEQAASHWLEDAANRLTTFVMTGKIKFSEFANSIIADMMRIQIQRGIAGMLSGGGAGALNNFSSWFGGAHASGGIAPAGKVSLVGEAGPELIVPSVNSTVIPNSSLGGANVTVNVINQSGVPVSASAGAQQFDGERYIQTVVLKAIDSHGPLRAAIAGVR